jgi:NitT/TauT family transport system permease protein
MMGILSLLGLLVFDTLASWIRMFIALGASILLGLGIGIYAARRETAEKVVIPIVDILQTLPILAFFPFVIYVIVATLPGYIGINAAVIFLIITSMLWNIIFGVYEAVKTLPQEFLELAALYKLNKWKRLAKIYVPASMPKVIDQSTLSFAIGLFYLVTSEIFSTANSTYAVKYGIGVELTKLAISSNFAAYAMGIAVFIAFVIATRLFFFAKLEKYYNRYNAPSRPKPLAQARHRPYAAFAHAIVTHLPKIRFKTGNKQQIERVYTPKPEKKIISSKVVGYALLSVTILLILSYRPFYANEGIVLVSLAASFARVWLAFALITVIAVPLVVYLLFMSKHASSYLLLFQILASIPATILLPIIVTALKGLPMHDELVAFTVYFLSGIWYVVFSTLANKAYIPTSMLEVKRIFGVKGIEAWKKMYFYAILPGLITGAVTGIAAEWNASIVAEYFTTSAIGSGAVITSVGIGIGKLLDTSLDSGNLSLMLLGLLNLTIMIVIINRFVWNRLYRKIEAVSK